MKRFLFPCLLATLCLPVQHLRAQDKAQEKPKTEERVKVPTPVKVQIVFTEVDGRFHVFLIFDRSALYPNKSTEGERLVSSPGGQPVIRQFRTGQNLILKDGQTSENLLSTDPLTGHTLRVSVTINAQK